MTKRKTIPPAWRKLTKKELHAAYDKIKKEFTAADLQKYTVKEKMYPFGDAVKELERMVKEHNQNQSKQGKQAKQSKQPKRKRA